MSQIYKLQLDLRLKKDTPDHVIDFLVNGHLYDEQIDFAYFHGEDAYEEHNIFTVKISINLLKMAWMNIVTNSLPVFL